jgi:hypothetical protein
MITFIITWILGMVSFALYDAYIGFGYEFDGNDWAPLPLAVLLWPVTLVFVGFHRALDSLKATRNKRITRAAEQKLIRIAVEKETQQAYQSLDDEMGVEKRISKL